MLAFEANRMNASPLFPSSQNSVAGNFRSALCGQLCCARFATFTTAKPSERDGCWILLPL